ncbi:MAG: hypothetical protein QOD06_3163 [Candidatus Binatota bacterium]|nr:hypothetical protein [Candidatus Binatota bacterium]
MRDDFHRLADWIAGLLQPREIFTAYFRGEESDFVRFGRSRVRQAGSVLQRSLTLDLIEGARHATGTVTLAGDPEIDRSRLVELTARLRAARGESGDDPFLHYSTDASSIETAHEQRLPERGYVLSQVERIGRGRDLVGIHASGSMHAGFASSFGQRSWSTAHSFHLDWSFHREDGRAAKASYAGFEWQPDVFERRFEHARQSLELLARPPRTITPGGYRVFLTPAALAEILGLLSWGGFGVKAERTRTTPLLKMIVDDVRLHPGVTIVENTGGGIAPAFEESGFRKPPEVVLVRQGAIADRLVSARSAREYGMEPNGAGASEAPLSVDVAGGDLEDREVLRRLGRGVWIGNLWYLNFSDRNACRLTGLTRFASFWVEDGELSAPLATMRFDETIYRMLGANLLGLTREREVIFDPGTYGWRSCESARVPGALVEDFRFTL